MGFENGEKEIEKKRIKQNYPNWAPTSLSAHCCFHSTRPNSHPPSRARAGLTPTLGAHVPSPAHRLLRCRAGPRGHHPSPRSRTPRLTHWFVGPTGSGAHRPPFFARCAQRPPRERRSWPVCWPPPVFAAPYNSPVIYTFPPPPQSHGTDRKKTTIARAQRSEFAAAIDRLLLGHHVPRILPRGVRLCLGGWFAAAIGRNHQRARRIARRSNVRTALPPRAVARLLHLTIVGNKHSPMSATLSISRCT